MYKIIIDSCGELTEELKADGHFVNVALEMEVNGYRVVDDETCEGESRRTQIFLPVSGML